MVRPLNPQLRTDAPKTGAGRVVLLGGLHSKCGSSGVSRALLRSRLEDETVSESRYLLPLETMQRSECMLRESENKPNKIKSPIF